MDAGVATSFLVAGPYDLVKGRDGASPAAADERTRRHDQYNGNGFSGPDHWMRPLPQSQIDPITQRDYYALQAVFAGVNHAERTLPLSPQTQSEIVELEEQKTTLLKKLKPYESISVTAEFSSKNPLRDLKEQDRLLPNQIGPNRILVVKRIGGGRTLKTKRW